LEHDWEDKIEKVNHEDIANQTFDNLMELSLEWEQKMRKKYEEMKKRQHDDGLEPSEKLQ